ncbi:MAG: diaminopimelate epimerase [Bacteroidetes bacterium]|nr:diaminopimelate epimerase [Bacteroidota bacterium]
MQIQFTKYQGTGNDFIILDNRNKAFDHFPLSTIQFLCNRHFGIGADGLMLLNEQTGYDFGMTYFNSDGNESSMCGNGGRCITAFANELGIVRNHANFYAIDGAHQSAIQTNGIIDLKMNDVTSILIKETFFQLNTGSPHYVHFSEDVKDLDVKREGALIRYSPMFKEHGINVNFVELLDEQTIYVRTYERGVEDETLSCGTGVTASALSFIKDRLGNQQVMVKTLGGELQVGCENMDGQHFRNIWLSGPAKRVFQGVIHVE